MKKITTTLCMLLLVGTSALMAQDLITTDAALHERVTALSQRIAETAKLNEGQYVQVKRLNLIMMTEMENIKARNAASPAKLDEQTAELLARYDWDLASLLQPKQLAAYNNSKISVLAVNGH